MNGANILDLYMTSPVGSAQEIVELYSTFVRRVEELDLTRTMEEPPMLNVGCILACIPFPGIS